MRFLRWLLVAALAPGCSADPAPAAATSGPAPAAPGSSAEAPAPAPAPAAAPTTPSDTCLGPTRPLTIAGGLPYVMVRVGTAPAAGDGAFLLDLATTRSTIDLAAFSAPRPKASGCDPTYLGERCTFHGFDLFGDVGDVQLVTADHEGYGAGVVRPAGILGTDLLSRAVFTLDYAGKTLRRAEEATRCDEDELAALGFAPLSSAGFYAATLGGLAPLGSVVSDAPAGVLVPNVPSVPLRIGAARAPAQLDTGFDDYVHPLSINVNEAFFAAITKASPKALVRAPARDLSLSTCAGIAEQVEAYVLAPGADMGLVDEAGADAFNATDATVFVKRTPAAARSCGGIGTWTAPAAQVGATLFARLGATVFDPFASRVWVRKAP